MRNTIELKCKRKKSVGEIAIETATAIVIIGLLVLVFLLAVTG